MTLAITHAGPAHADEFIALAILVGKGIVTRIERRNPTKEELNNPNIWVIDVGGRHQPELKNFDHHGVPGTDGQCAFDLVLNYLQLKDAAVFASPWLQFKSSLDCYGPQVTATLFDIPIVSLYAAQSPIENQILQMFSTALVLETDWLFSLINRIGTGLIDYWEKFSKDMHTILLYASLIWVKDLLFVDFRPCGDILAAAKNQYMNKVTAAGCISVDDRDPGCENRVILYRHNDHPRIDFRRIDNAKMHFIHHGGFLAKTLDGDNTKDRIVELLNIAVE